MKLEFNTYNLLIGLVLAGLIVVGAYAIGRTTQKKETTGTYTVKRYEVPAPPPIRDTVWANEITVMPYDTAAIGALIDSMAKTTADCQRHLIAAWQSYEYWRLFGRQPLVLTNGIDSAFVEFAPDRVNMAYHPIEKQAVMSMNYGFATVTWNTRREVKIAYSKPWLTWFVGGGIVYSFTEPRGEEVLVEQNYRYSKLRNNSRWLGYVAGGISLKPGSVVISPSIGFGITDKALYPGLKLELQYEKALF